MTMYIIMIHQISFALLTIQHCIKFSVFLMNFSLKELMRNLFMPFFFFKQPDNVGTITINGTPQETTKKIINREPLTFRVTFPYSHPVPKLVRIVYDNNLLCTGPEGIRFLKKNKLI